MRKYAALSRDALYTVAQPSDCVLHSAAYRKDRRPYWDSEPCLSLYTWDTNWRRNKNWPSGSLTLRQHSCVFLRFADCI